MLARLADRVQYHGIAKHKANPTAFGLPLEARRYGDATRCDEHAGFRPTDMASLPSMLRRGILAGLVGGSLDSGVPTVIWAIGNTGWIFEARITNVEQAEYHGYPVRPTEAIAEVVYQRFSDWVRNHGDGDARRAATACRDLYGFKT